MRPVCEALGLARSNVHALRSRPATWVDGRTQRTPRGVAVAVKGAWPKLDAQHRNINALHAGHKADMGESTAVHGIEVTVTAA